MTALLAAAGFARLRMETISREVRFDSADEWVRIQFAATPLTAVLEERELSERERLVALVAADVRATVPRPADGVGWAFRQEAHLAVAAGEPR